MAKREATPRADAARSSGGLAGPRLGRPAIIAAAAVLLALVLAIARCAGGPSAQGGSSGTETANDTARDIFIGTWAERIDAFNEGYELAGYGSVFAAAAYDYGIDPRYSPAIARVESESGNACFLPYNAWGWGDASWSDWGTAIYAHAQGLSEDYSPTLTYEDAQKYNPAMPDEWYEMVDKYMTQIWPTYEQ